MIKRYRKFLALAVIPVVYAGCADDYNFTEPVRAFTVTPQFTSIDEGTSIQLQALSNGAPVAVNWSSDNTGVLTVNGSGLATATAPGRTAIIATLPSDPTQTGSSSITVNALQGIQIQKGVPVTGLSGAAGTSRLYRIFVPVGTTQLTVTLAGGPGDADLFVQRATPPTNAASTHFSFNNGNGELIQVANPQSGTWYILVDAFSTYSGATLTATYTP